jgi:CDP-diacylglycerol--serine O-phosphatidyltransferase
MRLAQLGRFDLAVIAIVFAGLIDGLDGPAARILNAASQFGAELDSLSDYVCFGVTPSFVLYFWKLHELDWIGWFACLVFTLCMQCRLARFNAGVDFNTQHGAKNFFMGVPAPGGAGMAVMPIVGSLMLGPGWWSEARYVAVYHVLVGACLVSKIPTFSSKLLKRSMFQPWRVRALVAFLGTAFFVGLYALPWHTLTCCFVAYIASWPVSFFAFRRLNRQPVPVPPYIYHMPHGADLALPLCSPLSLFLSCLPFHIPLPLALARTPP